jgi:thiol-disulfide isomerase/thioredoxin
MTEKNSPMEKLFKLVTPNVEEKNKSIKNKVNPILKTLNELTKQFEDFYKNHEITQMFKILNSVRVLQGKVMNKIHNLNNDINKINDETKFKALYKLGILRSILTNIDLIIIDLENKIRNILNDKGLNQDEISYDNSEEVFQKYEPIKFNYNDNEELTIEDVEKLDRAYLDANPGTKFCDSTIPDQYSDSIPEQHSNSMPEQKTEDILKRINDLDYKKNMFFGGNLPCMTLFYAPWCGWSKKMLPEWEKLENQAKRKNGFIVKKFNSDQHSDMMEKFGITGFPAIKLIKPNETIDYSGDRTAKQMMKFIEKHI